MKRILINRLRRVLTGLILTVVAPLSTASATETYCAVTKKTSDGFVEVREGPGWDTRA